MQTNYRQADDNDGLKKKRRKKKIEHCGARFGLRK
jgi:hypothetical protein